MEDYYAGVAPEDVLRMEEETELDIQRALDIQDIQRALDIMRNENWHDFDYLRKVELDITEEHTDVACWQEGIYGGRGTE